ncbi:MAG: M28 family peptidase [Pseudarcicella sp.]|nr:M28 family peptidase [Pseudarcicella sp.]MBP6409924.1 M28 family peptidase [Pseudarcicella sp.]
MIKTLRFNIKIAPIGILCFCLLFSYKSTAQKLASVFKSIDQEVSQNSLAYKTLGESCQTIGHRLTGSANGAKAENFAFQLLNQYGFKKNVKFHPFEAESWARESVSLSIAPRKSDNFQDFNVVSLALTPVSSDIQGSMVDVGNGLEPDFEAKKELLKGKIALINLGLLAPIKGPRNLHRSEKTALAIQYGAIGAIFVNTVKGEVLLTGTASVTGAVISIPAVCISLESGTKLRDWISKEPELLAFIKMKNFSGPTNARNVIATIPGTDKTLKNEKIVIGGHLDSWDLATGALDNGIGSFSILDIARTFKKLGLQSKRTIEFVVFMGEEEGLLGSKAYLSDCIKDKSINKIKFMLNLDMANNTNGFNTNGRSEMTDFFTKTGEIIKTINPTFKNNIINQATLHSDHQSYMMEGIPTAEPLGDIGEYAIGCYHANCDKFDLIKKEEMQNTVRYNAMMLYALANASKINAPKLNSDQTKAFFIKQNLRKELELGKAWRWGND